TADEDLRRLVVEFALLVRDADGGTVQARQPALGQLAFAHDAGDKQRRFQLGSLIAVALRFQHASRHGPREVLAAEETLARRRPDFERALEDLDERDIEGAAAQVEDKQDLVLVRFVETVGQSRGGWLVEDAVNLQSGNATGV